MCLLDTNAFIILMFGKVSDRKLSQQAMEIMLNANHLFLSIVSLWEISIKMTIGKIQIRSSIEKIETNCHEQGIVIVPIKATHMDTALSLPFMSNHKDPFDRLILATSIAENMPLISTDYRMRMTEYAEYGAQVIW